MGGHSAKVKILAAAGLAALLVFGVVVATSGPDPDADHRQYIDEDTTKLSPAATLPSTDDDGRPVIDTDVTWEGTEATLIGTFGQWVDGLRYANGPPIATDNYDPMRTIGTFDAWIPGGSLAKLRGEEETYVSYLPEDQHIVRVNTITPKPAIEGSPPNALIEVCYVAAFEIIDINTGEVVDEVRQVVKVMAFMVFESERWRYAGAYPGEIWIDGCDEFGKKVLGRNWLR